MGKACILRVPASGLLSSMTRQHRDLVVGSSVVTSRLLVGLDRPIKDVIVLEPFTDKQVTEKFAKVRVVGLVVEAKGPAVVEVDGKLVREASAENLGGGSHLWSYQLQDSETSEQKIRLTLLHDAVVLLLLGSSLQTLPRQLTTEEILFVRWCSEAC